MFTVLLYTTNAEPKMLQIKNTYTDSAAGSGLEKKSSLAIIHKRVVYYTHGV